MNEATNCMIDPTCVHVAPWREALAHALTHPLPLPEDRAAWVRARRTFVGASEMPAILGESLYSTALDVWVAKVHTLSQTENEPMRIGNLVEPMLRDDFAKRHKVDVALCETRRHRDFAFSAATPDGDVKQDGRLIQIKNVGAQSASRFWQDDEPPKAVLVQVQWELEVYDRDESVVIAMLGGNAIREYRVRRDRALGIDMRALAELFWQSVESEEPPTDFSGAPSREALLAAFPRPMHESLAPAPEEIDALAVQYDEARSDEKEAKERKEEIAATICTRIGEGLGFKLASGGRVTWGGREGQTDWKGLALSLAPTDEQIAEYQRGGFRVLDVRLTAPKGKNSKR